MSVGDVSLDEGLRDLKVRLDKLNAACDTAGRDVAELDKILLHSSSPRYPFTSVEAFVDWASRHAELGVTELVLPWPVPDSVFASDAALFERIAVEAIPKLHQSLAPSDNGE